VHPFPTWSDHLWRRSEPTWDVQRSLPLSAIVFLEQGPTDEAIPIGKGEATACIMESASQVCHSFWRDLALGEKRGLKEKVFDNACELARSIPAFKLRLSLDGRFWEELDRILL
jgi:SynChlorMet cassette protein ScmC